MNLTIEQLSKATKLSISTIRVYASQRNLGKKIGNKRVYSKADVQALLKGPNKSSPKKTPKAPAKNTARRDTKPEPIKASKPKAISSAPSPMAAKPVRHSLWNRLFGGRKPTQKLSLLDAKVTK